ncbi:MAG TPA: hypothetical protein VFA10_15555 [Ktedonobacteraceae bacterium]|nr:hypothetical protein [Ktedonobacteraceae bacterium]
MTKARPQHEPTRRQESGSVFDAAVHPDSDDAPLGTIRVERFTDERRVAKAVRDMVYRQ